MEADVTGAEPTGASERASGEDVEASIVAREADEAALGHSGVAFPLERDAVLVEGPDAAWYLQGQLTQDLRPLEVGGTLGALVLSPQGRLVAPLRVVRLAAETFLLDVESGAGAAVVDRLERYRLRTKVVLHLHRLTGVGVRARPEALAALGSLDGGLIRVATVGRDLRGVDLLSDPRAGESTGAAPIPEELATWHRPRALSLVAWRIERGVPLGSVDLDERTIPAEADLVEGYVSFTKGCYTGQELVARLEARGSHVPRRLRGLVAPAGPSGEAAVLGRAGDVIEDDRGPVGRLTSVGWSVRLGAAVGLGLLARRVEPGTTVDVVGDGGRRPAKVAVLPLVDASDQAS